MISESSFRVLPFNGIFSVWFSPRFSEIINDLLGRFFFSSLERILFSNYKFITKNNLSLQIYVFCASNVSSKLELRYTNFIEKRLFYLELKVIKRLQIWAKIRKLI
ncbi:hypothetical protein A6J42_07895 [Leptospira interrogans serovar Copenhageni]|nr:hypothetical protein A6J42_07895 [Leptospira interrogans serovar Copenhageni]KAA5551079.1 hypothetical protein F3G11_09740 [Leptospira interrogans serovar Copenhageni]NUL42678.1 hypothetical protein [Leptospira interrogans serovar Copenhageni]QOI47854.1 hypothetical protein Lepto898_14800 [Leptospira interrogans serovar Icterohaemorrhagiae]WPM73671.1 hypothetical protein FYB70_14805 [Leptospira interrogans serovar Icterohaemorrhagiae]